MVSAARRLRIWDVSRNLVEIANAMHRRRRGHANKNACFLGESHMRNSTSEARWKSIAESKGVMCGYLREGVEGNFADCTYSHFYFRRLQQTGRVTDRSQRSR